MNYGPDTSGCSCGGRCLLELIRARAYQIYESRGREPGHEVADWVQAEHEVKQLLGFEPLSEHT